MPNKLLVITGPTAVGKTDFSISLAQALSTEIVSADSRQFYAEIPIGTAAPTTEEMKGIKHHFVGHLSIHDYYNVSMYEQQALEVLKTLFQKHTYVVLTGGSGMYIDVLCNGIDNMPDIDMQLRNRLLQQWKEQGTAACLQQLQELDPVFYNMVDKHNHKRILRALEVCYQTGKPYSESRCKVKVQRDFEIVKICLTMPREQLVERINRRTDKMMEQGLLKEAQSVFPYKHLNALNTVGYRELFDYLEGKTDLDFAIDKIKVNTRRYAKRQMTWFKKEGNDYIFMQSPTIEQVLNII
ncbi:MAG: tRNA (adenosine(37)-N6)-dimethylallyltransferase MiaA [Bacteroidales bacterium]|nr:tRNA (adenosine(37)-N6)-dimethylallyltransferase MiaA [Bacteroidales bacterium]